MLMGTYEHRLDTKARLVLPQKIREKLSDTIVLAAGLDKCVSLYSESEWEKFSEKIKSLPFYSNVKTRDFARIMLGSAHETLIDGTGRVLLPGVLRAYAQLDQDVVVNGANDHVEIWDKERWADKWKTGLENLSEMVEGVDGF
jgi:MraZ protein